MSTINGLPAHVLLVHLMVVLAPLTAASEIICGVWSVARRRYTWFMLALAVLTAGLTPLTTDAGEWLEQRVAPSAAIHTHTQLGGTMIYFSVALLAVALAIVAVHVYEKRSNAAKPVVVWAVAALTVIVGVGAIVQVVRIGDSGAHAAWDWVSSVPAANE